VINKIVCEDFNLNIVGLLTNFIRENGKNISSYKLRKRKKPRFQQNEQKIARPITNPFISLKN
jgi:hypothetical protein